MPDFEIAVTCTQSVIDGEKQQTVKSVVLENFQRNTAIPAGIDEIMKWAAEETAANPKYIPIPLKAIEYWNSARANGNLQLYEIQSNLETWGVTFGLKELAGEPLAAPAQRNGHKPARTGSTPPAKAPRLDVRGILTQQLDMLQVRQREVIAERKRLQSEYEENQDAISDITAYLMINKTKRRRKPDVDNQSDKEPS